MASPSFGFFISLSLAIYGTIALLKHEGYVDPKEESVTSLILRYVATGINTIRSFSAFIATIKALHSSNARSLSVTGILMLAGSTAPSVMALNERDIGRAGISALNFVLTSFATFLVAVDTAHQATSGQALYGDVLVFGSSTCINTVLDCNKPDVPLNCSKTSSDDWRYWDSRSIDTNVTASNCLITIILILFLAAGALAAPVFAGMILSETGDASSTVQPIYTCLIFGIVVSGLITIPIHGVAERGQVAHVQSGGLTANGSTWSTCVSIREPYEYWGYLKEWWDIHKDQAIAFLPLV